MDKNFEILKMIQDKFPDCRFTNTDNLIWIYRGNNCLHILEFNTLKYYYEVGVLEDELNKLKEK